MRIEADQLVLESLVSLRVRTALKVGGAWTERNNKSFSREDLAAWPVEIVVAPRTESEADKAVEVVVEALDDDGEVLTQQRRLTAFALREDRLLMMGLSGCGSQPLGFVCESDPECHGSACQTCEQGSCEDTPTIDADELLPYAPVSEEDGVDAGAKDGGRLPGRDATGPDRDSTTAPPDSDPDGASEPEDSGTTTVPPECVASAEVCDKADNDCDGKVDEDGACPTTVTSIAVGDYHACAVLSTGTAKCWGSNLFGEAGATNLVDFVPPTVVLGIPGAVEEIATGGSHSCARLADRTVSCWGRNENGELGQGFRSMQPSAPVAVPGLRDVSRIAAASSQTCAVHTDGTLSCWGAGRVTSDSPTLVPAVSDATDVVCSDYNICVLRTSGRVSCWGDNSLAQLGIGSRGGSSATPVDAELTGAATQISAGQMGACAVVGTTAQCWGVDPVAPTTYLLRPTPVKGLGQVLNASMGLGFACAVATDGRALCWGENSMSQLGDGTTQTRASPVPVASLAGALEVRSSKKLSCARLASGGVSCWGDNSSAQLGTGSTSVSLVPVKVPSLP